MSSEQLRDLIFSLQTRKFGNIGEIIIEEFLVSKGYVVEQSDNLSYDRKVNDIKDEFKCSRVWIKSTLNLDSKKNILESILNHSSERNIKFDESRNFDWDCNIQQIKTNLFSYLWYALFFEDKVVIFKISSEQIQNDENIKYSDKQHRGNEGEGQFHVTNKNLEYHLENFLIGEFTYDEIYSKLSE